MSDVSNPGKYAATITPNDSTDLSAPTRAIYVGVTGNISVRMYGQNNTVIFANVPVGILPIQVAGVNATGTTATNLVALW